MSRTPPRAHTDPVEARVAILKAFLMRAESLGWVNSAGRFKLRNWGKAWEFWQGVKVSLAFTTGSEALFDEAFFERLKWHDPVVATRGMHAELCAQLHARRVG